MSGKNNIDLDINYTDPPGGLSRYDIPLEQTFIQFFIRYFYLILYFLFFKCHKEKL